ncbi:hypothetical protein C0966_12930 [Bacillus methanolicus]|uniref:hypothetical protein n=1 Tax=Bacillus methanolicus TaxID=1471 RepID=UPI0023807561|nr:hypothetical protein [Bacillus methanolicus]MDE3840242.1 hypothetical protein [Bacillus methanolicus]
MSEAEARLFLIEIKSLISQGRRDFITRWYNLPNGKRIRYTEALLSIGLTSIQQAWDEILKLKPRDYFKGPNPDRDRPNDGSQVWEFKKEVNGIQTYIKLKIDHRGCVCMSFHEDWS